MKNLFKILALVLAVGVVFSACKPKVDPPPVNQVEDGIYLVGNSIFADSMQLANVMTAGQVEDGFDSKTREGLYYKFIYATSSNDGFVIKEQKGAETIVWGASLTESIPDTAWTGDIVADGDNFTVSENGFYMVAVDFTTSKVFIYRVNSWNVVGSLNNWGDDTIPMTEISIDKENASWEITDVVLRADLFKFRINRQWNYKIAEEDGEDVKLQTNLGTDLTALVQGGTNLENTVSGEYTITLNWNFAAGFTGTTEKTADLVESNWTGIPIDLVGDGVSSDNGNAVVDDIWSWGNKLEDDNGSPSVVGVVYTWTWTNVVLEADSGFKIRCNDGGLGFNNGTGIINYTASSTHVAGDNSSDDNITVDLKASYDITLVIDASDNDSKVLTIVDHVK